MIEHPQAESEGRSRSRTVPVALDENVSRKQPQLGCRLLSAPLEKITDDVSYGQIFPRPSPRMIRPSSR